LDDAVVDHGDAPVRVELWVRVAIARLAVRGPARVPDARGRWRHIALDALHEAVELTRRMLDVELARAVYQRDAGGVIAAILQPPQPIEDDRSCRPLACVPDDSAHVVSCFPWHSARVLVSIRRTIV